MTVTYDELDGQLKKKIDSKPGKGFTIFVAVIASFLLPLLVAYLKDIWIDRPGELVELTYDINQPEIHAKNEYLTDIEMENIGRKNTGESPVTFEIEFADEITHIEWRINLDISCVVERKGKEGENKY